MLTSFHVIKSVLTWWCLGQQNITIGKVHYLFSQFYIVGCLAIVIVTLKEYFCLYIVVNMTVFSWDKFLEWNCWTIFEGFFVCLKNMVAVISATAGEGACSEPRPLILLRSNQLCDKFCLFLPLGARGPVRVRPSQSLLLSDAFFIQVLISIGSTYIITSVNLQEWNVLSIGRFRWKLSQHLMPKGN